MIKMAAGAGTGRNILTLSLSSNLFSTSNRCFLHFPPRVLLGFKSHPLCTVPSATVTTPSTVATVEQQQDTLPNPTKQSILLEKLRVRHLRDGPTNPDIKYPSAKKGANSVGGAQKLGFDELGLREEIMAALGEMGITQPTEIQCIGIPAVLDGDSVVLGSHTGSGKTLGYMLPIVQLMKQDEDLSGILMKPRRPRAIVLCPTRELSEQVFRVAKCISHHARFRCTMVSGGGRIRPQEDSLNMPIDMVVGTPGRILQHIEEGNLVFGDIKYLVLDEADTMFDHGFGTEIRKFLTPLKNRASKPNDPGFQTVLVAATMTKAVQKLIDEEFEGITHLRTSTLHKKVASARHDFIRLSGAENKLEALLQVLEPSLSKGNKVMVFCNTLDSSRAVDHFLGENQIYTVNYHGEVPAEQRVENLKKFKNDVGDCPTLVCTDLAARGLDMDVDHVIMFDFPKNSVDYLHRTGRTARMGAKGKVTSLVTKRDIPLAARIEEAMKKNESLESLSVDSVRRDIARTRVSQPKGNAVRVIRSSNVRSSGKAASARFSGSPGKAISSQVTGKRSGGGKFGSAKSSSSPGKAISSGKFGSAKSSSSPGKAISSQATGKKSDGGKFGKSSSQFKGKSVKVGGQSNPAKKAFKSSKSSSTSSSKRSSKISVVGFRGRSSTQATKN